MKLSTDSTVPVYTIAGASTGRPLPEWLARKRKRSLKQDSEYANRIELLQDFEFEEASTCVRVSNDGNWVVSTGTYKPQIHVHYLPHLSLSYARHTNALNQKFVLLSDDYSKSLHLQSDRFLEFHMPGGLHYSTRIPRYGRDLVYNSRNAEALIPAVGVNADNNGEVFRLNLDLGRFVKGFEVDVGGDDYESLGGGALQGGIRTGAVNCAAVANESHGLLAFGTTIGTVEFWDSRSRSRVSMLGGSDRPEVTALEFHKSGLQFASGNSEGIVQTYDLRSPVPLLRKDQGYGEAVRTIKFLTTSSRLAVSSEKVMTADKKGIKLWDALSGEHWTSVEPAVDLNHVEWVPDSGMFLTANEGRQQHSFFVPQLGPAPRWCGFLDNLVEEMAEDADDPSAFNSHKAGEVYDNFKFLDMKQLREVSLDHLIGQTNLLRPYMHGYFVGQQLYEQARLMANPDIAAQQRQKSIQEKIDKERESRIRGSKKTAVKVNRRLADKLAAKNEAHEQRKAERLLRKSGDNAATPKQATEPKTGLLQDDRFTKLFEDEDFEIDETSREFAMHNPSTTVDRPRGLTAAEKEDESVSGSDSDEEAEEEALRARQKPREEVVDKGRIGNASYKKSGHRPQMQVVNSAIKKKPKATNRSFGEMAVSAPEKRKSGGNVVGEMAVSFTPAGGKPSAAGRRPDKVERVKKVDRRSASGNVMRSM